MKYPICKKVQNIKPSGIRKFFDIVSEMKDAISLGVGEPDFETPWHIRDEGIYALEKGKTFYTSNAGLKDLRKEITHYISRTQKINYDPLKEIIVTVGGSEAIDIGLRAMINPGDEVIIPQPSYVSYEPCAVLAGAKPVIINLKAENNFRLTAQELRNVITNKTKVLILPYPNNPTGAVYPKEVLEDIIQVARENDLLIFSDEIYDRLVMDGVEHYSTAALAPDRMVITMNGLSKSHIVCGFRCGWMCISGYKGKADDYVEGIFQIAAMRLCGNALTQLVIPAALEDNASTQAMLVPGGRLYEQREAVIREIDKIDGLSVVKNHGAFYVFPKLDVKKFNITNDEQFALDLLRDKHILVTCGTGFNWKDPDHFRIVYLPKPNEIAQAIRDIGDFLNGYWQKND